jgi:uncharacterized lipoprotein YmbA
VAIPAAVDRPQFVIQKGPNQVAIDEFNRWAAPLAASIGRTVAENLVVTARDPAGGQRRAGAELRPRAIG